MSEDKIPSRKLGVKYLDPVQMKNSFPDCDSLIERLNNQRQIAAKVEDGFDLACLHSDEYYQMYDNVFAILGGRGAGKSSVIFSLRERLKLENQGDIFLPIITPDLIDNAHCSILGWIMASIEPIVKRMEKVLKKLLDSGYYSDHSSLHPFHSQMSLCEQYNSLFQDSFLGSSISSSDDDVITRAHHSKRQYRLLQSLNEFWQLLVRTQREILKLDNRKCRECGRFRECGKCGEIQQPLIVLMFDDIDLAPERSLELLTSTFQYFSTPNIVLILTTAQKVLRQVIECRMYEKMVSSTFPSLLQGNMAKLSQDRDISQREDALFPYTSVKEMAEEFYGKTIPPSSRYYIQRYKSIDERMQYAYSSSSQSFAYSPEPVSFPIDQFLIDQVDRLIKALPANPLRKNFLKDPDGNFRKSYLAMLGDKNRNIANGCLEIMNTVDQLIKLVLTDGKLSETNQLEVRHTLKHLISSLIISKRELGEYEQIIERLFFHWNDEHFIFVNYPLLITIYFTKRQEIMQEPEKNQIFQNLPDLKNKLLCLMLILFFAENFLLLLDPKRESIHGYRELAQLLNSDILPPDKPVQTSIVKLFRSYPKVDDFLDNNTYLFETAKDSVYFNPYGYHKAQTYLSGNFSGKSAGDILKRLNESLINDRQWVESVLSVLFVLASGIKLVTKDFIGYFEQRDLALDLFSFTGSFRSRLHDEFQKFLKLDHLFDDSQAKIESFLKGYISFLEHAGKVPDSWLIPNRVFWTRNDVSLAAKDKQYSDFVKSPNQLGDYLQKYTYYRWDLYLEQTAKWVKDEILRFEDIDGYTEHKKLVDFSHSLIHFTTDVFSQLLIRIQGEELRMKLRYEEAEELKNLISDLTFPRFDIQQKKRVALDYMEDVIRNRDYIMSGFLNANPEEAQDEDADVETVKRRMEVARRIWSEDGSSALIQAKPVLDFMFLLQSALFGEDLPLEYDQGQYYSYERSVFFQALEFLLLTTKPESISALAGGTVPLSTEIILNFHMLEELLPYYYRAHMVVAMSTRYHSEVKEETYARNNDGSEAKADGGSKKAAQNEDMSRFYEVYDKIVSSSDKNSDYYNLFLSMQDVRERTARERKETLEKENE